MPDDLTRNDIERIRLNAEATCEIAAPDSVAGLAAAGALRLADLVEEQQKTIRELATALVESQNAVENGITLSGDYLAGLAKARALLPEDTDAP